MKKQDSSRWLNSATVLLLFIGTMAGSSPISRMDIYDAADNHLLFVTFAYNGSGECTGRSVFTSDSTFLRGATFAPKSETSAGKDEYVDYDGNTVFTTTIQPPSDGKTSFSTVDQFGLSQYGTPLTYRESDPGTFTVSQDNAMLCRQEYIYDDDKELTRINVADNGGKPAWYALITHEDVAVQQNKVLPLNRPMQVSVNGHTMRLGFGLTTGGVVGCELISPAGRKVLSVMRKRLGAGGHQFFFKDMPVSAGAYIIKMTVNGKPSANRMVVVQE